MCLCVGGIGMHSQAGAGPHREGTWRVEAGRVFQSQGPELVVSSPRAAGTQQEEGRGSADPEVM